MCLAPLVGWKVDGLDVRVRYSRGADFSGTWKGGIVNTLPSGETRQTQQIHMTLAQQNDKVTGTMGPSEDKQVPIEEGKVDGNRVRLVQGGHRVIELTLSGDRLVGTMKHANDATHPAARLELQRVR